MEGYQSRLALIPARIVWSRVFHPAWPSEGRQIYQQTSECPDTKSRAGLDPGGSKTRPHTVVYGRVIFSGFIS
jgi:hypothetical protein